MDPPWKRNPVPHLEDAGPFDIIGDIHGCYDETVALLETLGYAKDGAGMRHPRGRRAVFLGDLVDRGPRTPDVLRLVMAMVAAGEALAVPGNHDDKLARKLGGREMRVTAGLRLSLEQLALEPPELSAQVIDFVQSLPSHYLLDDGRLCVAHAGMRDDLMGRSTRVAHNFALYGESSKYDDTTPARAAWAEAYRGRAVVVYGHTPVVEASWLNGTICVDTGCVFGGRLSALRYPEKEVVSVGAPRVYFEHPNPAWRGPPVVASASGSPAPGE
jgi:protein phosphatase